MALGVVEDVVWEQKAVQIAPGEVLVLYTDGVTDAQNAQQAFFGEERLLEVVQSNLGAQSGQDLPAGPGLSAQGVQAALMTELHGFVSDAPQYDDITLMIVVRE